MTPNQDWAPLSEPAAELLRTAASRLLADPSALFEVVDAAVFASAPQRIAAEPALNAGVRASDRANLLHWIAANASAPGARVPAQLGPEVIGFARDVVRRGFDDTVLHGYRAGQNAAFLFVIRSVLTLTDDPQVLREVVEVISRSLFAFVDDTLAGVQEHINAERAQLTSGTHAQRLETVNLILEGAPVTRDRATARLGYELAAQHCAAVVWSEAELPRQGALEQIADALARAAGAARPLTVVASARSLWVWFVVHDAPDVGALAGVLPPGAGVRVAVGTTAAGMAGFRRSHLDALATQRLMSRMPTPLPLATYGDVRVVALAAQDEALATEFVRDTLGDLTDADPTLRETVRTYIRERFSAAATARALYTHRNTVLGRLERAQRLLPVPLEQQSLEVGLALEIVHWLGVGPAAQDARTAQ